MAIRDEQMIYQHYGQSQLNAGYYGAQQQQNYVHNSCLIYLPRMQLCAVKTSKWAFQQALHAKKLFTYH